MAEEQPVKVPGKSRFLWAWVGASIGGSAIGLLLGLFLAILGANEGVSPVGRGILFSIPVALAGLVACAMQALALRRRIRRPGFWALAGGGAWILAGPVLAVALWLGLDVDTRALGVLVVAGLALVAGAMVGATHWLVIQGQASGARRWVLAGAVGWPLGTVLPLVGASLAEWALWWDNTAALVGGLLLAVGGAVAGPTITGAALAHCLRRSPDRPANRRRAALVVGALWLLLVAGALVLLMA
jgi:hypothetical protein